MMGPLCISFLRFDIPFTIAIKLWQPRLYCFGQQVEGDVGKAQLEGEFIGMQELHKLAPEFVPRPYAYGKLNGRVPLSVDTYFLLMEFRDFAGNSMPDAAKLGKSLAELHDRSQSPNGMFGFPLTTYDGSKTQVVDWDSSWTSFFSKLLAEAYRHDIETNGQWDDLHAVFERTQTHLIPRLIGALETDGRSVKPCLIHGDLWDGNIGTDANTGLPFIFDAAVYYAHHEMELGIWRAERHRLRAMIYRKEYIRNMMPSEPVSEWDDRNRLYSTKTNLMHSACFVGSPYRQS